MSKYDIQIISVHVCTNIIECASVEKKKVILYDKENNVIPSESYWVLNDTEYDHKIFYCPYCGISLE